MLLSKISIKNIIEHEEEVIEKYDNGHKFSQEELKQIYELYDPYDYCQKLSDDGTIKYTTVYYKMFDQLCDERFFELTRITDMDSNNAEFLGLIEVKPHSTIITEWKVL